MTLDDLISKSKNDVENIKAKQAELHELFATIGELEFNYDILDDASKETLNKKLAEAKELYSYICDNTEPDVIPDMVEDKQDDPFQQDEQEEVVPTDIEKRVGCTCVWCNCANFCPRETGDHLGGNSNGQE